ncbi:MAG: DUF3734 domain-containing protein [Rhodobacteraceae bacterium]|nr:DUF3734 domain-containing protein [Paracoccaceae bacterium]
MDCDLAREMRDLGRTVLVLQGGGALGAYQLGVYEALHEAGVDPDWVIGTSIGAINAAIIAGNAPADRLDRLRAFWNRVEQAQLFGAPGSWWGLVARNLATMTLGLPAFFRPNPAAFAGPLTPLGPEAAGYYSTDPLRDTLADLIDFDRIAAGETRLTVGASSVSDARMRYFDSRDTRLTLDHVMASGALPPAFPAVRIDGALYWDGGIVSNTPLEAVFDDLPRRDALVFAVHIWNPHGPEPGSIWQVLNRLKDLQYSSRAESHIQRQRQIHRLRHVVAELAARLPAEMRDRPEIAALGAYGCLTRMHVVRLIAPALENETHMKDIDFSPEGIRQRWDAGYRHTRATLDRAPWRDPHDPEEGLILHEACGGEPVTTAAAAE